MRRALLFLLSLASSALAPRSASAADTPRVAPTDPAVSTGHPAERRSGAVIGLSLGYGLYGASGYPNNGTLIGNPAYYSASNLMRGSSTSVFVMDAVTDYLSFGLFVGGGTATSADWRSTSFGAGFRIELFPFYRLFPVLRDLGVSTKLGFGRASVGTRLPGNYPNSTGSQSLVAGGVFYEFSLVKVLGGHLAAGPSLDYESIIAPTIERHGAALSGRLVFYGGM